MCTIKEKLDLNEFTGYKVVIINENNEYYSPYTGIKYMVGKVPEKYEYGSKYHIMAISYNETHEKLNLTGVMKNLNEAIAARYSMFLSVWLPDCVYGIIKIKLSGDIYEGTYCSISVILGNEIAEITDEIRLKSDIQV